jgi:hypothetical protein
MKSLKIVILFLSILTFAVGSQAAAAQKSGDGNAIPYPKKEWKGVQGKTLADSKPDFIGQPKAPKDAPNVLVVMLDDAGYSNATSFGGVMKRPPSIGSVMKGYGTPTCPWPQFVPRQGAHY